MRQLIIAGLCLVLGAIGGYSLKHFLPGGTERTAEAAPKPIYWVAPMDPSYRRDGPGKSPMGMDLVPVYADEAGTNDSPEVRISPRVENNLGVRTALVERSPMALEMDTVGYIQFDEDTIHHIHTRVEGWVEKLHVAAIGDSVSKGEVLFDLYSPELLTAQNEYVSALRSGNKALIDASGERLLLLGMSKPQFESLHRTRKVNKAVSYISPINGFVSELNVRHGMFVSPSTEALAVGRLDSVWVIAEVFERQMAWLEPGLPVRMTVDAYPGIEWQGEVELVYPQLDASSRTARARIRFANEEGRLKPNMFANLRIQAVDRQQRLTIPRSALIRGGRNDRVVLALGEGSYQSVLVTVGIEAGDRTEILQGLEQGDRVVTSAHFLLDSESSIDAESVRMDGPATSDRREGLQP